VNIVYLIGNGFDLNLDLKTSYKDFYNYYKTQEEDSPSVHEFKNDISENVAEWSDLELRLGEYTKNLSTLNELDEIHASVVDELAEYLKKIQDDFVVETLSNIDAEKFQTCLFHPETYLRERDKTLLRKFYSDKGGNLSRYHIVSFNYTNVIEHILNVGTISNHNRSPGITRHEGQKQHSIESILHLHGSIDEDMVLGVDRANQIINEDLSENIDAKNLLVKTECNSVMRHGVDLECERLISNADIICIFGSSIGDTDQTWWDQIATQLKTRNCRLVIFEYNSNFNKRRSQLQDRLRKQVLKKFFEPEEIEEMSERVYFSFNSQMFSLIKDE
jgi:hypothetical protein